MMKSHKCRNISNCVYVNASYNDEFIFAKSSIPLYYVLNAELKPNDMYNNYIIIDPNRILTATLIHVTLLLIKPEKQSMYHWKAYNHAHIIKH